jgi:2-alkenal reductase
MMPDNVGEVRQEPPTGGPPSRGGQSSKGLVIRVLGIGMLVGFALGWISFLSPWSAVPRPAVLYDQDLVTSIYEDISPAVVEIRVRGPVPGARSGRLDVGSGFVVDGAGRIVTNHHVVAREGAITVRFSDGRTVPATRLGTSPADDLAVIQVEPEDVGGIVPLPLADSDEVKPGQMAIAVGSPFREFNSVTVGVVSGTGRSSPSVLRRLIPNLIQTNAALNPGNSGGPLLDSNGEVIGVNFSVEVVNSVQIGVGYAIPSNTLRGILPDLLTPGELKRPWIGISGAELTGELAVSLDLGADTGIYIDGVWEGSPAQEAGLRSEWHYACAGSEARRSRLRPVPGSASAGGGDVITAVDGDPVSSVIEMISYFNTLRPQDDVTLTILRDNEVQQVEITLAEWAAC